MRHQQRNDVSLGVEGGGLDLAPVERPVPGRRDLLLPQFGDAFFAELRQRLGLPSPCPLLLATGSAR
jgi:hypothetical protein